VQKFLGSTVLAGDRQVWRWAAIVGVPLLVVLLVWCLIPRAYYTGTDSVNAATFTTPITRGVRVCADGLNLPAGSRQLQLAVASGQARAPRLLVTVHTPQGSLTSRGTGPAVVGRLKRVAVGVPSIPGSAKSVPARVCVRSTVGTFALGASETTEGLGALRIAGKATLYRAAVWYLPRAGARRSYLEEFGTMADRDTVLAPGFVRPWLLYFVFFGVLPLIALLSIRLLALGVAGATRTRRLVMWLFLIAALNGMSWSVITPAFQSPDEVDHFAYTESLVERGIKPTPYAVPQPARWSTAENEALLASDMLTDHLLSDTRAPDLPVDAHAYRALMARTSPRTDDGGGYQTTASYGPLYYYAVAPGYLLGGSTFSRLGGMRLLSALIGALAGVFALLTVRELVPRRPWIAVLAGLVVTFEPMYSFLSGAVNNDIGIDAGAAVVAYLLVRLVRRGLPPWLVLGLGVLLGVLPWVKSSAYELWVLALIAVALAAWRHRARLRRLAPRSHDLLAIISWLGAVVLLLVAYLAGRHLNTVLTPSAPVGAAVGAVTSSTGAATGTLGIVEHQPLSFISYLWQVFFPNLPGMTPHFPPGTPAETIFVRRGWAAFGWYDTFFPGWVYTVLVVAMAAAVLLGIHALWMRRATIGQWWPEVALVLVFPLVVFAGFEAAFYTVTSRLVIAEMGRYEFPALVPLAALGVGGLVGLGRRVRVPVGVGILVLFLAFCYASQALTFVTFFS
jgi:hypothetical protein